MASIERQRIRAIITIGGVSIVTPDVVSFNVNRARGQMCSTFSASVKIGVAILTSSIDTVGETITIKAGVLGNEKLIFTGIIYKCTINPVRTDASKVALSISGKDMLSVLEGKKISRRVSTYRDGSAPPARWGVINGITRENTLMRKRLKTTLYTADKVVVSNLDNIVTYVTPSPFSEPDRNNNAEVNASLVVESIPKEES